MDFYKNHDVAMLVGQTISIMILKARDDLKDEIDKAEQEKLTVIAEVVPERWQALVDAQDTRVVPLTETGLWTFIQDPKTSALDMEAWRLLLEEWCPANLGKLSPSTLDKVSKQICVTFASSWREALKHDYEHGGKAWAGMQLDMMGEQLRRSASGAAVTDPDIKRALAAVSANIPVLKDLISQVRLEQTSYDDDVIRRFDAIRQTLDEIAAQVAAIKADTAHIRLITDALANKLLKPNEPPSPEFTPEQVAALKVLESSQEPQGVAVAAVAQAAETKVAGDIEKARAALAAWAIALKPDSAPSPAKAREYYTLKGDLAYFLEQFDDAIEAYRKAFAIAPYEFHVRSDLASALIRAHGPNSAEHQREAAWIYRQSLELNHLSPRDEGLARNNLAATLLGQGDLKGAQEQIEKAIAIGQKNYAPDDPELGTRYSNLAVILEGQGDLKGAREQMEKAIAIDQKNYAPDDPELGTRYSNLAMILQDLGDLKGAREQIEKAIAIDQKNYAPDHPGLGTDHSNLALILQGQGDLKGAREQIEKAIAIGQKNYVAFVSSISSGSSARPERKSL